MIPSALRSSPGFPKELASLSPSVSPNNATPPAHLKTAASFPNSASLFPFPLPTRPSKGDPGPVPCLRWAPSSPSSLIALPPAVPPTRLPGKSATTVAVHRDRRRARESRSDSPLGWMWLVRMVPASRTCHSPVPTRALAPSCSHRAIPRQEARGRQEDGTRPGPEEEGRGAGGSRLSQLESARRCPPQELRALQGRSAPKPAAGSPPAPSAAHGPTDPPPGLGGRAAGKRGRRAEKGARSGSQRWRARAGQPHRPPSPAERRGATVRVRVSLSLALAPVLPCQAALGWRRAPCPRQCRRERRKSQRGAAKPGLESATGRDGATAGSRLTSSGDANKLSAGRERELQPPGGAARNCLPCLAPGESGLRKPARGASGKGGGRAGARTCLFFPRGKGKLDPSP